MGSDLRNLAVAVASAALAFIVVWYFAERAVNLAGIGYTSELAAYLPGWAFFVEELLPGFLVGLLATRWQILAGALVSYLLALGTLYFFAPQWSLSTGVAHTLFGKALLSAAYGVVGALAGSHLRLRMRANYSVKWTAAVRLR